MFVSKETLRRWGNQGRRGVFLDTAMRSNGVIFSSREALRRFAQQLKNKGVEL
jgi:hypothetical protein